MTHEEQADEIMRVYGKNWDWPEGAAWLREKIKDAIRAAVEARDAQWIAAVEGTELEIGSVSSAWGNYTAPDMDATRAAIIAAVKGGG